MDHLIDQKIESVHEQIIALDKKAGGDTKHNNHQHSHGKKKNQKK